VGDGRGKSRQFILTGAELLRFRSVGEGLGVRSWVAALQIGTDVVEWTMDGGVEGFKGRGRGG